MNNVQSVVRDIVIDAPIEKVWQALTEAEQLNRWYTKEATVDFRVGGRMELDHGWGANTSGVITEIEQGKHFILQSEDTSLTITTLTQESTGVRVTIEYQLELPLGDVGQSIADNMAYGTLLFLENLKSVYEADLDNRANMWKTRIGVQHTTVHSNDLQPSGSKVLSVKASSHASVAGFQPEDIIIKVNDTTISSYSDVEAIIQQHQVDDQLILTVWRAGDILQLPCRLDAYPIPYSA